MEDEVSVVKPRKSTPVKKSNENLIYKLVLGVIGLLIVIGVSFYTGISYQKGHQSKATASTSNGTNSPFGGGLGRINSDRTIGRVTAISDSSITVQPDFGGSSSKTFGIVGTTTVINQGQSSSVSAIAVGDTVVVTVSTTNTNDAASISVNPAFGNFGPNAGSNSTNSSGSSATGSGTPGSGTAGSASTLN